MTENLSVDFGELSTERGNGHRVGVALFAEVDDVRSVSTLGEFVLSEVRLGPSSVDVVSDIWCELGGDNNVAIEKELDRNTFVVLSRPTFATGVTIEGDDLGDLDHAWSDLLEIFDLAGLDQTSADTETLCVDRYGRFVERYLRDQFERVSAAVWCRWCNELIARAAAEFCDGLRPCRSRKHRECKERDGASCGRLPSGALRNHVALPLSYRPGHRQSNSTLSGASQK